MTLAQRPVPLGRFVFSRLHRGRPDWGDRITVSARRWPRSWKH